MVFCQGNEYFTMVTGPNQKPPEHPFYGPYSHRGFDPWHRDSFPAGLEYGAPRQDGPRGQGWFLEDAWGNEIDFVLDGTKFVL